MRKKKPHHKSKKITIVWHFDPLNKKAGKPCKYVYLKTVTDQPSGGPIHLMGFDLKHKKRFVSFYNKKVAKQWAKNHKFKVVKKKLWKKKIKKLLT